MELWIKIGTSENISDRLWWSIAMGVIIKTRKMIEGAGHLSGLQTTLYNAMIKSITVIKRKHTSKDKNGHNVAVDILIWNGHFYSILAFIIRLNIIYNKGRRIFLTYTFMIFWRTCVQFFKNVVDTTCPREYCSVVERRKSCLQCDIASWARIYGAWKEFKMFPSWKKWKLEWFDYVATLIEIQMHPTFLYSSFVIDVESLIQIELWYF